MSLTGKQKRFLRGLGHGLAAVVQVGKEGVTGGLVEATDAALETHELIKVRIGQNATVERKAAADELAQRSQSDVAQVLGNTFLLYRAHPKDPQIRLPKAPRAPETPETPGPAPSVDAELDAGADQ